MIKLIVIFCIGSTCLNAALSPNIVTGLCPPGSAVPYYIEITEDLDGNGVYDHRSSRDCDGKWSHDCWPVSCNKKTLWGLVAPTAHHGFSATYSPSLGIYTWTLVEYSDSLSMVETGRLERQTHESIVYIPALPRHEGPITSGGRFEGEKLVVQMVGDELLIQVAARRSGQVTFALYDLTGQVVRAGEDNGNSAGELRLTVPTASLPRGVYIVKVSQNGKVVTSMVSL